MSEKSKFRRFVLALAGCCTATAMATEPVNPASDKPPIRVACVGDSITQGSGAAKGKSYPAQLQELLGTSWVVGNFGVSGEWH